MTNLRFQERIAKRNHSARCELSGVPIHKGDRYLYVAGVSYGDFSGYKCHPILNQICNSMSDGDGWFLNEASEYLLSWLEKHLGPRTWYPDAPTETNLVFKAAMAYWEHCRLNLSEPVREMLEEFKHFMLSRVETNCHCLQGSCRECVRAGEAKYILQAFPL